MTVSNNCCRLTPSDKQSVTTSNRCSAVAMSSTRARRSSGVSAPVTVSMRRCGPAACRGAASVAKARSRPVPVGCPGRIRATCISVGAAVDGAAAAHRAAAHRRRCRHRQDHRGGLILRELIDRGEADRFAVLCPPHLVEEWTGELNSKFGLDAAAVTASSAPRLERWLPPCQTLFDAHPYTVVSLDYIKAERRRDTFARACPKLVVVDEAHACVGTPQSRQQRFELLKRLAEDGERHLLLLTATPHSGDEAAFDRLLSLLNDEFAGASLDSEPSRIHLARHSVQRRRVDITGRDWGEERVFPRHETAERAYELSPEHRVFHDAVLDYCFGVVEGAGPDQRRRRLAFWGTLALMRCVGSSPAAALSALRNRLAADPERLEEQVFDDDIDEVDALDVEPAPGLDEAGPLASLVARADGLTRAADPKLDATVKILKPLIADGANPVVFCRFIATADHVAAGLRKAFPKLRIETVTGALTPEDRRARVDDMAEAERRLL